MVTIEDFEVLRETILTRLREIMIFSYTGLENCTSDFDEEGYGMIFEAAKNAKELLENIGDAE